MILFIVGLTAYITYRTFGGITRAIAVLEGLTQGDHTQKMPERHGLLASKNDEVGHLSTALHSYRGHLLEMEDIRKEQAKRRKERNDLRRQGKYGVLQIIRHLPSAAEPGVNLKT